MTVQVKNRDTGDVLGTVEIPEDRFPYLPYNGTHYGLDYESGRKGGCTVAAFPTPFQLAADTNFVIEMSAPATADYWMWALHSGKNNFGYSTVEAGPRGTNATFAERSLNGGTSWSSLLLYERTGRSDVDANVVLVTELAAPPPPPPPSA